jgi:hypothetical protein
MDNNANRSLLATAAETTTKSVSVTTELQTVAVPVLGYISVLCWCLIFCPQLLQNYRQHSAVGLSSTMFLLWAFSGFATIAYVVYEHGDISLIIQWMMMSLTSLGVVFQIYGYETFKATPSPHVRWLKAALATSCWVTVLIGWLIGTLYLFRAEISPALPVVKYAKTYKLLLLQINKYHIR